MQKMQSTMKSVVCDVLKKKYPHNFFIASIHLDTDNPHVHACLSKQNTLSPKKIDIRKYDLAVIRHEFSKMLNQKGFEVDIEPEAHKTKVEQFKTNDFKIVGFGNAKYQFNELKPESYYVQYLTNRSNEVVTVWGKGLQDAIESNNINIGDRVNLKKERSNLEKQAAIWSIKVIERVKEESKTNDFNTHIEKLLSESDVKPIDSENKPSDLAQHLDNLISTDNVVSVENKKPSISKHLEDLLSDIDDKKDKAEDGEKRNKNKDMEL